MPKIDQKLNFWKKSVLWESSTPLIIYQSFVILTYGMNNVKRQLSGKFKVIWIISYHLYKAFNKSPINLKFGPRSQCV